MSVQPSSYSAYLAARLQRLREALVELRSRVRVAVAEELGKIIAETVRDVVTLTVGKLPAARESYYRRTASRYAEDDWDDPYDRDESPAVYSSHPGVAVGHYAAEADPHGVHPAAIKSAALALGVGVARWCIQRQRSTAGSVALGLAAGMIALSGGPLTRAGLGILATARDLLGMADALDVIGAGTSPSR